MEAGESDISNNTVINNDYGIYTTGKTNNNIYHNNIINNTNQAYDDTVFGNRWDNGYPSGGNYWSDYDGFDNYSGPGQFEPGPDGIGDDPYFIDEDSIDEYPLMDPVKNFMFLYEGWNLISMPLIQSDTGVGAVLSSITGHYRAVQWYNASDSGDHWKSNFTTKPQHLNDMDNTDHIMGFWINITKPGGVKFYFSGYRPLENQSIALFPGWNLVGFPSLSNKNRTAALNNLTFGIEVDSVWTHDPATKTWEEIGPSDHFELCRGYWIHATTKCTWEVPL